MVGEVTTGFLIKVVDKFSKPLRKAEAAIGRLSKSSGSFTKVMKKETVASRTLESVMARTGGFENRVNVLKNYVENGKLAVKTTQKQTSASYGLLRFLPKLGAGFVYLGIAAAAAGIKLNANKATIEGVVSSSKEADAIFSRLKRFGETTPVSLSQIVKTDAALIAFTGSQKKAEAITKSLTTVAGAFDLNLDRVTQTYMRVRTQHRFGRAELRTLGAGYGYVIAAMKKMAIQNGWTAKSFTDALNAGKISSNGYVAALNIVSKKGGAAYKMMQAKNGTFMVQLKELGAISTNYLDDLFKMFAGNATLGGGLEIINNALRKQAVNFSKVSAEVHKLLSMLVSGNITGFFKTFGADFSAGISKKTADLESNLPASFKAKGIKTTSVHLKEIGTAMKTHFQDNVRLSKEAWAEKRVKHHVQITVHDPRGHIKNVSTRSDSKHADFSLGTNMSTALEF